jgi:uncharacterized protein YkwD
MLVPSLRSTFVAGILAVAAFIFLVPSTPAHAASGCKWADAHPENTSAWKIRSATLCLLNVERRKHGLRSLRSNGKLRRAGQRHTRDMVPKTYFAHASRNGTDFGRRIRVTGYARGRRYQIGENLAWGSHDYAKPRQIVRMWMNSPGHRANVLRRKFREVGVALSLGAPSRGVRHAATYATEFGGRL